MSSDVAAYVETFVRLTPKKAVIDTNTKISSFRMFDYRPSYLMMYFLNKNTATPSNPNIIARKEAYATIFSRTSTKNPCVVTHQVGAPASSGVNGTTTTPMIMRNKIQNNNLTNVE